MFALLVAACSIPGAHASGYTLYFDNTRTHCDYYVKVYLGHGHCGGCDGCCYEGVACDIYEPECADCCDNTDCDGTCASECCWVCEDQADPITHFVGAGPIVTPTLPLGLGVCSYTIYDGSMSLVTSCDTENTPGCTCTFDPSNPYYSDCESEHCVIDINATCISGTIKWNIVP